MLDLSTYFQSIDLTGFAFRGLIPSPETRQVFAMILFSSLLQGTKVRMLTGTKVRMLTGTKVRMLTATQESGRTDYPHLGR